MFQTIGPDPGAAGAFPDPRRTDLADDGRLCAHPDRARCVADCPVQRAAETEEVELEFAESGVRRIAEVAFQVNENTENIGARRLHTVMERLLETVSFEASDKSGTHIQINAGYVDDHLAELSQDEDLSRYIL